MITAADLDERQYARKEILKYEAIYGRDFVSPGGLESARRFIGMLGLAPGARVLDAGCGLGGSAFVMAREHAAHVVGIDLSRNMIALARERAAAYRVEGRVSFVHGDCLQLDVDAEFDAVYSRDAFLHVHDKPRLFGLLRRALKPGGRIVITDYCAGDPPWTDGFAAYVRERGYDLHTTAAYQRLLEDAGLRDVRGEDLTAEFAAIHQRELARLPGAGLAGDDEAALAAAWRAKIERILSGEQRWGVFSAVR